MLKRTRSLLFGDDEKPAEPPAKRVYECKFKKLVLNETELSKDFGAEEIPTINDCVACLNALFDPVDSNETVKRPNIRFESANSSRNRGISVFFTSQKPIVIDADRFVEIRTGFPPGTKVKMAHNVEGATHQLIFTVYFK